MQDFNVDGSDGYQYHWNYFRDERKKMLPSTNQRNSIMVRGAFAHDGLCDLQSISGHTYELGKYQAMLHGHLYRLELYRVMLSRCFSRLMLLTTHLNTTRNGFKKKKVDVLPWPSRSPNFNSMENI